MEIDYEKEYKEALERAKRLRDSKYQTMNAKRVAEEIFPVLAESEDERVRKGMIRFLESEQAEGIFTHEARLSWIAYLEKQKESLHIQETCKENADSFTDACKDVIVAIEKYLDWLTGYPDYAPKGKYSIRDMLYCLSLLEKQKPENVSATTMIPSCWAEKQKEQKPVEQKQYDDDPLNDPRFLDGFDVGREVQKIFDEPKPAEWSEEDEIKLKLCEDSFLVPQTRQHLIQQGLTPGDMVSWLKSLRPQIIDSATLYTIEQVNERIREAQEWSEEDEAMYNAFICEVINEKMNPTPEQVKWIRNLHDRLKYLCPQPHWKPSEEQMAALEYFIRSWGESGTMSPQNPILCAAKSLYAALQKLL